MPPGPPLPAGPKAEPQACWAVWNFSEPGSKPSSIFMRHRALAAEVGVGHVDAVLPHAPGEGQRLVLHLLLLLGVHRLGADVAEEVPAGLVGLLELRHVGVDLRRRPTPRRRRRTSPRRRPPLVSGSGMSMPCSRMQRAKSRKASSGAFLFFWSLVVVAGLLVGGGLDAGHAVAARRRNPSRRRRRRGRPPGGEEGSRCNRRCVHGDPSCGFGECGCGER